MSTDFSDVTANVAGSEPAIGPANEPAIGLANGPAADTAIWLRPEPGQRRTRFSRDDIARVAVEIADADGIEAVSMRRVAAELGAGTMTLYHYLDTKADLFALISDAVLAENLVPADEFPDDWRGAMTAIARRTRAALSRHPWIFDTIDTPGIGPNGVRHFEQSIAAVDSLPISLSAKLDIVGAVDEYVFGFCMRERDARRPDPHDGSGGDLLRYLEQMIATGEFPVLARMIETKGMQSVWEEIADHAAGEGRFDRNLARLLDGIANDVLPG